MLGGSPFSTEKPHAGLQAWLSPAFESPVQAQSERVKKPSGDTTLHLSPLSWELRPQGADKPSSWGPAYIPGCTIQSII